MSDKRWTKRQRKRIQLKYGTDAPVKVAFTDDITHEGFFIRTGMPVNPGLRLVVEMTPPEGLILLQAEVRWAKKVPPQMLHRFKGGMGLKILAFQQGEEIYRSICDILYGRSS